MTVIDRLEALIKAATPGPWTLHPEDGGTVDWYVRGTRDGVEYELGVIGGYYTDETDEHGLAVPADNSPDAELVVVAINVLPDLLALVKAARELDRVRSVGQVTFGTGIAQQAFDDLDASLRPFRGEVSQ